REGRAGRPEWARPRGWGRRQAKATRDSSTRTKKSPSSSCGGAMTPSSIQVSRTRRSRTVNRAMSSVSRIISGCALSARVLRVRLLPLGHELSQRVVAALRRYDVNLDQLIAACARLVARHALAAQPQLGALLGALRHPNINRSVHRLDMHARAVQRLTERYR